MTQRQEIDEILARLKNAESVLAAYVVANKDSATLIQQIWDEIRPAQAASATLTITPNS